MTRRIFLVAIFAALLLALPGLFGSQPDTQAGPLQQLDTPTATDTPTETPANTPTNTPTSTPSATPTDTATATYTPTNEATSTPTSTRTNTPTSTPTSTATRLPTSTPTSTATRTPTKTPTPTPTAIPPRPSIRISKNPPTQTVAKGASAVFTIEIRNTGNVSLNNVSVSDPLAPDCNKTISSLAAGKRNTYSCGISNVTSDFTNTATVKARDSEGTRVSDSDTAKVEVENPNIQIVKSPPTQTLLKGETAKFSIFVVNTSRTVSLTAVEVIDPLAPDCSRQIGNLPKGDERIYSCKLEGVSEPFTNEISVSARNIFNDDIVRDSTTSLVRILDMQAGLAVNPTVVAAPGGQVQFVIDILNGGSVPFDIKVLRIEPLGNVIDPANDALENNSCLQAREAAIGTGQRYTCSFSTAVEGKLGPRSYELQAVAADADDNTVSDNAQREVIIANATQLDTLLAVKPSSLPAPGGRVGETVVVSNNAPSGSVNLDHLHHSAIGDLNGVGDCALPQRIAAGNSYSCEFELEVSGSIGSVIGHTVSAAGKNSAGTYVGNTDNVAISLFDPSRPTAWLPVVARSEEHPEEDNDTSCAAFPLIARNRYLFAFDDQYDWYVFDVERRGTVTVKIEDLDVTDVQVQIFAAEECQKLRQNDLISYNGDERPDKSLTFTASPGRHYLWITGSVIPPAPVAYSMVLFTP